MNQARAVKFLRSHGMRTVTFDAHIVSYVECVWPDGHVEEEAQTFTPDSYGDYSLEEIRDWLGY